MKNAKWCQRITCTAYAMRGLVLPGRHDIAKFSETSRGSLPVVWITLAVPGNLCHSHARDGAPRPGELRPLPTTLRSVKADTGGSLQNHKTARSVNYDKRVRTLIGVGRAPSVPAAPPVPRAILGMGEKQIPILKKLGRAGPEFILYGGKYVE